MTADDLKSDAGRDYLQREYVEQERSSHDIARELGTYPNTVLRALALHGIAVRTHNEAQAVALKKGRSRHPTSGRRRSPQTKERIGEKQAQNWQCPEFYRAHVEAGRRQWEKMSPEAREEFLEQGRAEAAATGQSGSRLANYLKDELVKAGYELWPALSGPSRLYVRRFMLAVHVMGPSHFYPLWGEQALADTVRNDDALKATFLDSGCRFVRVKNLRKSYSAVRAKRLLAEILKELTLGKQERRLIELEV